MTRYTRRQALALGAAAVAAPAFGRVHAGRTSSMAAGDDPFALGVTSGDPDPSSVVLWTRLVGRDGTPLEADDVTVGWEVASDAAFGDVTASGEVVAAAAEGHSVHVVAPFDGPGWYRFRVGDRTSPVGRAAPVPADARQLTIAAASCQHFETGYYAAHRDIAEWAPDLVVFLGDFIYEYGSQAVGGNRVRSHRGDEIRTLDRYRDRYAQYLGDADLQASRAACPWLAVWDDHETENNYAALTPEDPAESGDFPARRLAAYQAWWEHMPVRMARPTSGDLTIYRSLAWGALAKIVLLDGRQYRSDQACGDAVLRFDPPCPEALDPARTMLGPDQERWVIDELADVAQTWAIVGQQTVVSDLRVPGVGAIINYDQWDGYAAARDRLLLAAAQTERTVVLTGDIHVATVGRLPGIGVEFVTTSISSQAPPLPDGLGPDALRGLFPDVVDAEFAHRGYTRHTVTPERWVAEYRTVDDVADPASAVSSWRTFTIDAAAPDAVS